MADSATRLNNKAAEPENSGPRLFLKQSLRSNYCGVYSTGMLLSELGLLTTRHQALELFNLRSRNPDFPGTTLPAIANVFTTMVKIRNGHWDYRSHFDFTWLSKSILQHFQMTSAPTLLSFGAVHKNGQWKCKHVVVAMSASPSKLELLDPLGQARFYQNSNVWLVANDNQQQSISVIGSSYSINYKAQAAIFRWSAP